MAVRRLSSGWTLVVSLSLSTLGLGMSGCSSDDADNGGSDGACEGGKCDEETGGGPVAACGADGVLKDFSGNGLTPEEIMDNKDAIARVVLSQDGPCPLSVADVAGRLAESCSDHRSALVSERSQRLETFTDYRSVTMLDCDEGQVFLHYPILAKELGDGDLSEHLDTVAPAIIAQDESGVFNYYQSTGQDMRFFGNSLDMLKGTDLEALEPIQGQETDFVISFGVERSCAACHPGGGLLMKELRAPWVHWEPDFFSPQSDSLIESAEGIMGFQSDGIDLENAVELGNEDVNDTRIDHVLENLGSEFDVGDLLRPLFCTDEFNIGAGFSEDVDFMSFGEVVLDTDFNAPFFDISNDDYQEILRKRGSFLATEAVGGPKFQETVGGFTFLHRAAIDEDYVRRLIRRDLITQELATDIRLVDFTRSLYSDDRCGLVEFASKVDPSVVNDGPEAMTKALVDVLEDESGLSAPGRDLLANLKADGTDSFEATTPFSEACESRNGRGGAVNLLHDFVEYAAQVRKRAADRDAGERREDPSFMQFRFPGVNGFTVPLDTEPTRPGFRFHPQTCEITDEYIPLSDGEGGGGDPGNDADPPDDVDPGDCCVTCRTSQACGNGCISAALTCHQPEGCACQAE